MEPHHSYFDSAVQDNYSSPLSVAFPIWFGRNRCCMQRVQNYLIRRFSSIAIRRILKVVPPIDILSSSINVKFFIKVILANDLLTAAHDSSVLRQKSVANLSESHLRRFVNLVNNDNRFYTVDNINDFIELMWRR